MLFLGVFTALPQVNAQSKGRTALLSTLGSQGAVVIYNTYCLIGAMNDGYVVDAWEKDVVISIMDDQVALMENMCNEYDTLLATGYLDEIDSGYVADMRECCELLSKEAKCLKQYATDDSEESHDRYQEARSAAWNRIAEVLGFNEESSNVKQPSQGTK